MKWIGHIFQKHLLQRILVQMIKKARYRPASRSSMEMQIDTAFDTHIFDFHVYQLNSGIV